MTSRYAIHVQISKHRFQIEKRVVDEDCLLLAIVGLTGINAF
jgi:hypothetical protein